MKPRSVLRALRLVAGCSLAGTVTAGAALGWLPALGVVTVNEIGALLGAVAGGVAVLRHTA